MSQDSSKVTVIMPVFNGAQYISEAIESVLAQTYRYLELMVIDDGSTDDTRLIVDRYIRENPGRIRYLYQDNGGVSRARNRGIRESNGEFIAFLDADDQWMPENIALKMELFSQYPQYNLEAVFSEYYIEDKEGIRERFLLTRGFYRKFKHTFIGLSRRYMRFNRYFYTECLRFFQPLFIATVIARREIFEKLGYFPEDIPIAEDLEVWLRFCKNIPVGFVDEPLAVYYRRRGGATRNKIRVLCWNITFWKKKFGEETSALCRFYAARIISRHLNALAVLYRKARRYGRARKLYTISLRYNLFNGWSWRGIIRLAVIKE